MNIETIGRMVDYPKLKNGEIFFCHALEKPVLAMKTTIVFDQHQGEGVLAFSHELHPTMPAPTLFDTAQFSNKSVLVLHDTIFRTALDLSRWNVGTANLSRSGSVMLGSDDNVFIRAFHQNGYLYDVDVARGLGKPTNHHPERMWTEHWEIVTRAGTLFERVLALSAKPEAKAAA